MNKVLHLFKSSQFTEDFVTTVNKFSINSVHSFMIYGTSFLPTDYRYLFADNIRYIPIILYELQKPGIVEYFDSFDKIIYHGIFENYILDFFYRNSNLLKKLYLYFWGGDIPPLGTEDEKNIKKKIISKAKGIVTIIDSDYDKIVDLYNPSGKKYCLQYCAEEQLQNMKKYLFPHKEKGSKEETVIQIGNSATDTNNHIDVLNFLQKFKNENIKIFLPLAYGNPQYAEKVIAYAENIFEDKVFSIRKMMKMEEYIKNLREVDIGIFAMNRQQALGNIYMLGMNGCKLYINRNGQIDKHLSKQLHCSVSYIDEIQQLEFSKFISISQNERMNNYKQILKINETEYKMKKWNEFFEEE